MKRKKSKGKTLLEMVEKELRIVEKELKAAGDGIDELLSSKGALPPDAKMKLTKIKEHLLAIHPFQLDGD